MKSKLFAFFHLNIMYSAIEESDRLKVIEKCYWPLLNLIKKYNLPFSIELSGLTLEIINELDPKWIKEFKKLLNDGVCELIGCGYSQIIGPLVPAKLNYENIYLGDVLYKKFLGTKPKISLVNEQAFSQGLIQNYLKNNYHTIITEWENSKIANSHGKESYLYFPQKLKSLEGKSINLIWNNSINFQKFQRYAHGEYSLKEYIKFISKKTIYGKGAISLYGNDVEIFDFRPGRYMTESKLKSESEWIRIDKLFECLIKEKNFHFIKVSEVLKLKHYKSSNNNVELVTSSKPISVKKQEKYNIVRWAVSGRNDIQINTKCWQIYNHLNKISNPKKSYWKELCYLWSSDFRTHITNLRWSNYLQRLKNFENKIIIKKNNIKPKNLLFSRGINIDEESSLFINKNNSNFIISYQNHLLKIVGKRLSVTFNCYRGLAVDKYIDNKYSKLPLFGTIHHGILKDIKFSADYYSGHLVFQTPGQHKVTDLNTIKPKLIIENHCAHISSTIKTKIGIIYKTWIIDDLKGNLKLNISFKSSKKIIGSFRLGYLTILPNAFSINDLHYKTSNGGEEEIFNLYKSENFDHGRNISSLISTNQALGITDGKICFGDKKKRINVHFDKSNLALIGLMSYQRVKRKYLFRLALSAKEIDDTSKSSKLDQFDLCFNYFVS